MNKETIIKFKISDMWDDVRTLQEIEKETKFAYFFIDSEGNPAPSGKGKPRLVHQEDDSFLKYTCIDCVGGLRSCATGSAGKGFIKEVSKDYEMLLFVDVRSAIKDYLDRIGESAYYEVLTGQDARTISFTGIAPEDYKKEGRNPDKAFFHHSENG